MIKARILVSLLGLLIFHYEVWYLPPRLWAGCVWTEVSAHCGWAGRWLPASGGEAPCEAWSGLDSGRVWPSTETGVCVGGPAEAGGMGRGPRASWAVRQRMAQGHLEGSKVGRPCGSQCVRWSP